MRIGLLDIAMVFALLLAPMSSRAASAGETAGDTAGSEQTTDAGGQWFRAERAVNLAAVILFASAFFFLAFRSRQGKYYFIRPISGLDALGDAVGRAAEMGRPIAYIPGLTDVSDPATAASMSILSNVAHLAAKLRCRVNVPNFSPLTMPVARGIVKNAFVRAGREADYRADDVVYLTSRHMTYTMAVVGMLTRQKVAASFLIGHFFSESLILAETGASLGAKQIGGCDAVSQLPFFITTCDYTLIGEELFAAGALVSGDPLSRSTIVAHDWFKVAAIGLLLASFALMLLDTVGLGGAAEWASRLAALLTEGN